MASKMVKLATLGLGFAGWSAVLAGQAILQARTRPGARGKQPRHSGLPETRPARARAPRSAAIAPRAACPRPVCARGRRPTRASGDASRAATAAFWQAFDLTSAVSDARASRRRPPPPATPASRTTRWPAWATPPPLPLRCVRWSPAPTSPGCHAAMPPSDAPATTHRRPCWRRRGTRTRTPATPTATVRAFASGAFGCFHHEMFRAFVC